MWEPAAPFCITALPHDALVMNTRVGGCLPSSKGWNILRKPKWKGQLINFGQKYMQFIYLIPKQEVSKMLLAAKGQSRMMRRCRDQVSWPAAPSVTNAIATGPLVRKLSGDSYLLHLRSSIRLASDEGRHYERRDCVFLDWYLLNQMYPLLQSDFSYLKHWTM